MRICRGIFGNLTVGAFHEDCNTVLLQVLLTGYVYKTSAFDLQPVSVVSAVTDTGDPVITAPVSAPVDPQVDLLLSHGKLLYYHYPY